MGRNVGLLVLLLSIFLCLSPLAIVTATAEQEGVCAHGSSNEGGECIDETDVAHDNASEITEGDDEDGAEEDEFEQEEEEEEHGKEDEEHFDEEEYDGEGEGQGEEEYDEGTGEEEECRNVADDCFSRSLNDGCILDFENMVEDCRLTCYFCAPEYTLERISNIYSLVPQQLYNSQVLADYVDMVDEYMYWTIYESDLPDNIKISCKNKDSQCTHWAQGGECDMNIQFMLDRCPAACMACESGQSYETRCPFDQNTPVVWQPGDVNEMFTRLVTLPMYYEYSTQIVSRPIANPNPKFHEFDGPWIVVLDNFLSEEDCDTLVNLAQEGDFDKVFGPEEESEVQRLFSVRVCQDECADSGIVGYIEEQIEHLMGVPPQHAELIEFIKYEEGDFYDVHSDYLPLEYSRAQGPRIFSVIVFLNDVSPAEGEGDDINFNGGIEFPYIDTVSTRRAGIFVSFLPTHILNK